jgi:hypothetical protein
VWAVEKSLAMIREVWPAGASPLKQAVQGEWTCLPFSPDSFDIVIGDGCLTSLKYPQQQAHFLQALRTVLRSKGMMIMRHFVQADEPERPETVFADLREGHIGSFHAFKWRLAMPCRNPPEGVAMRGGNGPMQKWQPPGPERQSIPSGPIAAVIIA